MEGGKNRLRVVVNGVFFRSGRGGSTMKLIKLKLRDPSLARTPNFKTYKVLVVEMINTTLF